MIAFALGTPSLIQYDTSDCSLVPVVAKPLEWAHGIPIAFVMCVVQVNAWRASNPGIPNVNDWLALVLRTLTWAPRMMELVGEDSREDSYKVIARLAVQETWRHAILIYIYMVRASFSCSCESYGLVVMCRACVLLILATLEFSIRYNRYFN